MPKKYNETILKEINKAGEKIRKDTIRGKAVPVGKQSKKIINRILYEPRSKEKL